MVLHQPGSSTSWSAKFYIAALIGCSTLVRPANVRLSFSLSVPYVEGGAAWGAYLSLARQTSWKSLHRNPLSNRISSILSAVSNKLYLHLAGLTFNDENIAALVGVCNLWTVLVDSPCGRHGLLEQLHDAYTHKVVIVAGNHDLLLDPNFFPSGPDGWNEAQRAAQPSGRQSSSI